MAAFNLYIPLFRDKYYTEHCAKECFSIDYRDNIKGVVPYLSIVTAIVPAMLFLNSTLILTYFVAREKRRNSRMTKKLSVACHKTQDKFKKSAKYLSIMVLLLIFDVIIGDIVVLFEETSDGSGDVHWSTIYKVHLTIGTLLSPLLLYCACMTSKEYRDSLIKVLARVCSYCYSADGAIEATSSGVGGVSGFFQISGSHGRFKNTHDISGSGAIGDVGGGGGGGLGIDSGGIGGGGSALGVGVGSSRGGVSGLGVGSSSGSVSGGVSGAESRERVATDIEFDLAD